MMIKFLVVVILFEISHINGLNLDVLMPNVSPKTKDTYLCHKFKLDQEKPVYITEFIPKSSKTFAHHILLFSCEHVNEAEVWNCGEMAQDSTDPKISDSTYKSGPVCASGAKQSIIYAWAMDAPALTLPKDVAFKLGGNTDKRYIVLQVHYSNVDKFIDGETDNSGVILVGQTDPVPNTAGVYLLETGGYIQPHTEEHFEAACEINENKVMYPFAFRAHAHSSGILNSGYVVKQHAKHQQWLELGRRSPQLPQMFYPVTEQVPIEKGDVLAARCTMYNQYDRTIYIGATTKDEMCNFYLMYYVKGDELLENNICFTGGPPSWYFKDFRTNRDRKLDISAIPSDASQVPDSQIAELKTHPGHGHVMPVEAEESDNGMQDDAAVPSGDEAPLQNDEEVLNALIKEQIDGGDDSVEDDDYEMYLKKLERESALTKLLQKYL